MKPFSPRLDTFLTYLTAGFGFYRIWFLSEVSSAWAFGRAQDSGLILILGACFISSIFLATYFNKMWLNIILGILNLLIGYFGIIAIAILFQT